MFLQCLSDPIASIIDSDLIRSDTGLTRKAVDSSVIGVLVSLLRRRELHPAHHHFEVAPERIVLIQPHVRERRDARETGRITVGLGAKHVKICCVLDLEQVHCPVRAAGQIALIPVKPGRFRVSPLSNIVNGANQLLAALLNLVPCRELDFDRSVGLDQVQT